jgi:tetratricopeptide (TPR) repeat protein
MVGFAIINSMVFEQYHNWVIQVAEDALTNMDCESTEYLDIMNSLGLLYKGQEKYDQALPLLKSCLGGRVEKLGEDNSRTLDSMDDLAGIYYSFGYLWKAQPIFEASLSHSRKSSQNPIQHQQLGSVLY